MADLYRTLLLIGFAGAFGIVTTLLGVTYLAFTRMDKDVRRARMFIMEKRIERFLGAFTLGFVALTVAIIPSTVGVILPTAISSGLLFVWLAAMAYGTYELFFVVRPTRGTLLRALRKSKARLAREARVGAKDPPGRETDATK